MYHTSQWCRIVAEIGEYRPRCFITTDNGKITGLLPAMEIRSRFTGNRLGTLPFSDVCYPLADNGSAAGALIDTALQVQKDGGLAHYEMRGTPALNGSEDEPGRAPAELVESRGFALQRHFNKYVIALSEDTESIRMTFSKKSVRQTINKSARLGVTVRRGEGEPDLREFYRLYVLNRKRHGIPPQPMRLFYLIFERLRKCPEAILYMAEYDGKCVASLIVIRHRGVVLAKFEGVDEQYREVLPVYALLWKTIVDACAAGDHTYDFGRTASDNRGLNEFKSRWGTERVELPYYFYPPNAGISVIKSSSLKYRLFTGAFRRLPTALSIRLGERIFRHFG
jgi:CelD/BcsL family acetyltransferase involved in cellulose biosynthesis